MREISKYIVNDYVKVREDLNVLEKYGGVLFDPAMQKYLGITTVVTDIAEDSTYKLLNCGNFVFSADMLEPSTWGEFATLHQYDNVNHPSHYNSGKIEVIDFIEDKNLNFNLGNCVKYISRCDLKYGGIKAVEDLKKAKFYLEREIALREKTR